MTDWWQVCRGSAQPWGRVSVPLQRLWLMQGDQARYEIRVSTARNGVGQRQHSGCTPTGWHYVRASIGQGHSVWDVFRGRRWTGEVWSEELGRLQPERDWILGRILWLCGLEPGWNRGGQVDTFRRYIYLHASPPDQVIQGPQSHGCIRVSPQDILQVADWLVPGSRLVIEP